MIVLWRLWRGVSECIWQESGVRLSVLCWCFWQEPGSSCHEDFFTFNLSCKEILINVKLPVRFAKIVNAATNFRVLVVAPVRCMVVVSVACKLTGINRLLMKITLCESNRSYFHSDLELIFSWKHVT
jgi:hypothetical protein